MDTQVVQEKVIGRGVIRIPHYHFPEVLDIGECTLQGELKAAGKFDELHKRLLLPESYTIIGIFFQTVQDFWAILVESEAIPRVDDYVSLPVVNPTYRRNEDGSNSLIDIQIERY